MPWRAFGDKLIVALSTDEFNFIEKHKTTTNSYADRNPYTHGHSDTDCYFYCYTECHTHVDAKVYTSTQASAHSSPSAELS